MLSAVTLLVIDVINIDISPGLRIVCFKSSILFNLKSLKLKWWALYYSWSKAIFKNQNFKFQIWLEYFHTYFGQYTQTIILQHSKSITFLILTQYYLALWETQELCVKRAVIRSRYKNPGHYVFETRSFQCYVRKKYCKPLYVYVYEYIYVYIFY